MRVLLARLARQIRRFGVVESGVAAVEFALILPIMFTLYVGSVEAGALISMDRRVQSVAGAIGDLVARSDTTITASMLTDYFRAAGGIMTPYPTDTLRQVVTQVLVSPDGTTASVVWSKQYVNGTYGNGATRTAGSSYNLAESMRSIAKGGYVIVAESSYSYLPVYGLVINKPIQLYRENFFLPRFGGSIAVN